MARYQSIQMNTFEIINTQKETSKLILLDGTLIYIAFIGKIHL